MIFDIKNFQTPEWVCHLMVNQIPAKEYSHVLEPTPGKGNLIEILRQRGFEVLYPERDFFETDLQSDCVVMNPPFMPMQKGYDILYKCMDCADYIVALMPWLTLINSEKRTKKIKEWGLTSSPELFSREQEFRLAFW